jgi:TetR/AcrR family transcriptional regulator, transcriptional repressor of bet genes
MTKQVLPAKRVKRGRPPVGDVRRAQLADALAQVMAKKGYAEATIVSIASVAGLSPALVHHHFASKHEMLVELVGRLTGAVEARLEARLAMAGDDPRRRLEAFTDAYVARGPDADERAVAAWVVVGAEALREPDVRALYRAAISRALAQATSLVKERLAADGRKTRNAQAIAAALVSAIEGAYRVASAAPGVLPKGFAAPMLRRTIEGLVAAEEPALPATGGGRKAAALTEEPALPATGGGRKAAALEEELS